MRNAFKVLLFAGFTFCAGSASALDRVKIGILNGASSFVPLIADEKSFFKDQGLEAEFIVFDSGAKMIPSLATGELDVGIGAASSALYNAVGRGLAVKIVAGALRNTPGLGQSVMVRRDLLDSGQVRSLRDLKGMTVAITAVASSEEASLARAMRSVGYTFDDVEKLYVGFPNHVVAFQNKAIAAALTGEPFATLAAEQGVAKPLMTVGEYYPNQENAVVLFANSLTKVKREVGIRFLKAYLRGARAYVEARKEGFLSGPGADDLIAVLARRSSIKDPSLLKRMRANGVDPNGDVNADTLSQDLAFFKSRGQIESAVSVADVLDLSLVHEAARQMAP